MGQSVITTRATVVDGAGDDQILVAYLEYQTNPGHLISGPCWRIQLATQRLSGERAYRKTYEEAQAHAAALAPLARRLAAAEAELDAAKNALFRAFSAKTEPAAQPVRPVPSAAVHDDEQEPPF